MDKSQPSAEVVLDRVIAMPKYRAILFDLFGTIALIEPGKLPLFDWNGQSTRSTTAALKQVFDDADPGVSFAQFVTALTIVLQEQWQAREHDLHEVSCLKRFNRTLRRCGLTDSPSIAALAEVLSRTHNSALADATHVPAAHKTFLERARDRYRLALVSNFDDAPTLHAILQSAGIDRCFDCITISVDHGWRKPDRRIFSDTLARLAVVPSDALFIGDAALEDIGGAKRAGLGSAWINPARLPLPQNVPTPDYNVASLLDLEPVLFG